jgi:hypothetical protein
MLAEDLMPGVTYDFIPELGPVWRVVDEDEALFVPELESCVLGWWWDSGSGVDFGAANLEVCPRTGVDLGY